MAGSHRTGAPKRKLKSSDASRKRVKTQRLSANDLPWKSVSRSKEAWLGAEDGILELEEVDNVEVVYEETESGRVAKFNVLDADEHEDNTKDMEQTPDEEALATEREAGSSVLSTSKDETQLEVIQHEPFDTQNLSPNWSPYPLHSQLLKAIHNQGFASPTPIQARALPLALEGRDIIGVAETGSGKTLAYGLPILHHLLTETTARGVYPSSKTRRPLRALILAPTRELALQVSSHLNACFNSIPTTSLEDRMVGEGRVDAEDDMKNSSKVKGKAKGKAKETNAAIAPRKAAPLVSIAAIVGGMSAQKQRRILDRGVDVLVATPGRLWDILEEDDVLAKGIRHLKFLVLDEADRMVEAGHFAELDNILRLTLKTSRQNETDPEFNGSHEGDHNGSASDNEESEGENVEEQHDGLQTFVFSATMSKDLQRNLRKRAKPKGGKQKKPASTLDDLLLRLDFRDPEPEVIDLSPEGGLVSSLKEAKVECLSADKDVYLYYFLLRHPGRSLVFLSSIDGIRRLMPMMDLLQLNTFPLHSMLEQRQRLKNLDRFKSTSNSILLATDIAARGLDIPAVDHVIHYQIPRSADVYVHRNGRTARAMRKGFSMLMCAPDERRIVRALLGSLNRVESDIPDMSVDLHILDKLKARVHLAKQIDQAQHKMKKQNHEDKWLKEAAEAMEIELDSDFAGTSDSESAQAKKTKAKTNALKAELKHLLSQPLVAKGVSVKYITSGSRPIVDDMLSGESHEVMLGMKKADAGSELAAPRKKPVEKEKHEEWNGFSW